MITYVAGSLFESPASVLVNTVNTVGVMGKGVAAAFRRLYPEMYGEYRRLCEAGKIDIGTLWLYRTQHKSVLNFPTKKHWRNPSRPEYIEAGLKAFVRMYQVAGITSVAFPALGCGNGGLDFERQVQPLMERYLKDTKANVFIYPHRTSLALPEHADLEEMSRWLQSMPEDLPFIEVWEELGTIIADGRPLACCNSTMTFRFAIASEPSGIVVKWSDGEYLLEYEQLLDVWQELRTGGFSDGHVSGTSSSVIARAVQALFIQLAYVKPVRLAPGYENKGAFTDGARYGLQFVPCSSDQEPAQLSLLATA